MIKLFQRLQQEKKGWELGEGGIGDLWKSAKAPKELLMFVESVSEQRPLVAGIQQQQPRLEEGGGLRM